MSRNESVALSRTVPAILAWLVNPLVKSIPRNILLHLLRTAVLKAEVSSEQEDHCLSVEALAECSQR
jgi:hypothetical protein